MTKGRVSAAEIEARTMVVTKDGIAPLTRPDAPYDLTDEQSKEWWAVVNRMPPDWFPRETHGMLAQYCRHVVRARKIAQMLAAMEGLMASKNQAERESVSLSDYRALLAEEEKQTRTISSLATRMRITQQSTYDKSKKNPVARTRPWEV